MSGHAKDDARLVLFRDGLAFSRRLLAQEFDELEALRATLRPEHSDDVLNAFRLAWQLVDGVNRVRDLIAGVPGIRQGTERLRVFKAGTDSARELRNYVQHLRNELSDTAHRGSAWGWLGWVNDLEPYHIHTAVGGVLSPAQVELRIPAIDTYTGKWTSRLMLTTHRGQTEIDRVVPLTMQAIDFVVESIMDLQPSMPPFWGVGLTVTAEIPKELFNLGHHMIATESKRRK